MPQRAMNGLIPAVRTCVRYLSWSQPRSATARPGGGVVVRAGHAPVGWPGSGALAGMTSLLFPPVSDTSGGMPRPSAIRWRFEPVRARSTGRGPSLGHPRKPARETHRSPPWTNPAHLRRSIRPAGTRVTAARHRLGADRAATASRSSLSRSPVPGRTTRSDHPDAYDPDGRHGAARPATTARRPRPPSVRPTLVTSTLVLSQTRPAHARHAGHLGHISPSRGVWAQMYTKYGTCPDGRYGERGVHRI
jgi:hypothetical protein